MKETSELRPRADLNQICSKPNNESPKTKANSGENIVEETKMSYEEFLANLRSDKFSE